MAVSVICSVVFEVLKYTISKFIRSVTYVYMVNIGIVFILLQRTKELEYIVCSIYVTIRKHESTKRMFAINVYFK